MTDIKTLRQSITDYMRDEMTKRGRKDIPTWWMRHSISFSTIEIRAELKRMEADGLVIADRRQSNNTMWSFKDKASQSPQDQVKP